MDIQAAVSCRRDGLHVVETSRLRIVTNRVTDMLRYQQLSSEPQAQQWLGWRPEDLPSTRTSMLAGSIWTPQPMIPPDAPYLLFAGVHRLTNVMVGAVTIDRSADRADIGGVMGRNHRGQGLGSEMLQTVRVIAHRHFGISRLTAGCEATNHASRNWLTRSGFTMIDGSPNHTLPNGRVIQAIWWESTDQGAAIACKQLRPRRRPSWRRVFAAPFGT
ncbi:GNAT family N-acetyltransferase [Micromonospora sp. NPDC000089]|uniref:GNAT family N-acetyltransferase n=1 Tax=unclassified Micromonospora TaxID=2617518 RepID=UPI0036A57F4C